MHLTVMFNIDFAYYIIGFAFCYVLILIFAYHILNLDF